MPATVAERQRDGGEQRLAALQFDGEEGRRQWRRRPAERRGEPSSAALMLTADLWRRKQRRRLAGEERPALDSTAMMAADFPVKTKQRRLETVIGGADPGCRRRGSGDGKAAVIGWCGEGAEVCDAGVVERDWMNSLAISDAQ
ncbi:unnamed protein product [Cuscuta campestris]|uniref:Uncharacterized protein n=1 Tax=Cuscuta campestris TaxID=132261 RepID=A0A484KUY5_9ASTE|nr:unnamed protein product [Cuscuta campestris]